MAKTLGGSLFIRDGEKFDYPYIQAIQSLKEFCDSVVVCVVPTEDGTLEKIIDAFVGRIDIRIINDLDWLRLHFHSKHRLSIFTNYAIEMLDTDYVFNLQGDEIVDPKSYSSIRKAVDEGAEGYLCKRINLWKDPYHQLNVPHYRKPCSTEILRLAKTCYRAYDDAESIAAPCESKYVDLIKIWHYGFVRKKEVHPEKIRHMQGQIFNTTPDAKLDGMKDFEWDRWFSEEDLLPVTEEHPPLIREWIATRP